MRSEVAVRMLDEISEGTIIYSRWYSDLVVRINTIIEEKGFSINMDNCPSEIKKWVAGETDFTLRSLAKLQAELGEVLIEIPVSSIPLN